MAITIEELKSLIREETIREALQHVKENTEYFKRFANQLLLFLSYQTFEKAEETFLKIMSLENVWEMGNSRYTHYLQWLPREVLEDTVELLPAKDLLSLLEQLASLLLELGAEVEAKDQVGFAPLHRAITRKNLFMVHFLLNNGAIVDVKNNLGSTPLYDAVWIKNESLVRLLLEKGADVNAKDRQGLTPLHCWALWEEGDNPTAQLLLDKGAGDNPIGQLLLDKGANVNAKDKEGNTPLFCAVHNKDVSRAQLLLDKGADVNAKDKEGNTPLFCAVHNKDVPLAQLLLDKGADVNAKDSDGLALLHLAVQKQDEPMVRLLLEKGADANVQYCKTPLDMVADKEGAIAHLLQQYGGTTATLAQTAGALSSNLYSVFSSSSSSIDKESTNSHEASNADKPKEDEQIQLQK